MKGLKTGIGLAAAAIAILGVCSVQAANYARECEGNACGVVTVAWVPSVGKYLVSNNSDQHVKVEMRNFAVGNTIPLNPHEQKYSFVASYIVPYRANFD